MPLNRRMDKETCGILMQCSITQSLKKEIMKSEGILSEVFQKTKDNMVCIHIHVDISCQVNDNQATIPRTTEGMYNIRDQREQIDQF